MSGLETAIRTALENTDRRDANQRARVYQSARQALEKGLANQNITEPGAVARQRRRLDDIITAIEQEEAAAARKARDTVTGRPVFDDPFAVGRAPERPAPSLEDEIGAITPGESMADEPAFEVEPDARFAYPESPVIASEDADNVDFTEAGFTMAPQVESGHLDREALSPMDDIAVSDEDRMPLAGGVKADDSRPRRMSRKQRKAAAKAARTRKPVRRRRTLTAMMIGVIVIAFLLLGGWWMVDSNFAFNPENLDTSVPNPAPRIEAEDFEGASGWTTIFQPGTANVLTPGPQASLGNATFDNTPVVEIASNATGDAGAVTIALPVSVRGMLENGPVLIEISAVAPDGGGQPVGIYCADGTIEGCQRHRFTATTHRDSMVIRLDPSQGVLPSRLMIQSDLNGSGTPLDIFAIRARAAE
ncbi:hypothetical protein [Martelella soudanensis]|uniref:hypothetical protein n=1 Tax=unclassified Martelella TaxID=2629616 RepID=UPI0015DFC644|nr:MULTISPECIES: hypothetical protein [unclassified Martelella]